MSEPVRTNVHEQCRALISARLDGPLPLDEEWHLTLHLLGCAGCRQVERDYVGQRQGLRQLPAANPPRDLWARTSAALDRELVAASRRARRNGRVDDLSSPRRLPGMLLVSLTSAAMAVALVVSQLIPDQLGQVEASGRPTPFSVPGQAIAYIGADALGLTVYRTHVDHACPSVATDCYKTTAPVPARLTFPSSFEPSSLVLSPTGDRLAVMGWDRSREDIFGVVLMPPLEEADAIAPHSSRSPSGTTASSLPTSDASPTAAATSLTPRPAITALATTASGTLVMVSILEDVRGAGAAPAWSADGQTLAFSAMPADRSHGPDLFVWQVGDERARPITSDHSTYFASWVGEHVVVSRVLPLRTPTHPFGDPADFDSGVQIQTVVIDPRSGAEFVLDGPSLWLPQVNAGRTHAAGWHGTLERDGPAVVPATGALYLVAWPDVDPFSADDDDPPPDDGQDPSVADPTEGPGEAGDGHGGAADSDGDTTAGEADSTPRPTGADPRTDDPGSHEPPAAGPTPGLTLPANGTGSETPTVTPDAEPTSSPTDQPDSQPSDSTVEPSTAAGDEPSAAAGGEPSAEPIAGSSSGPADDLASPGPGEEAPTPSPDAPEPTASPAPVLVPIEPERDVARHPVVVWRLLWSSDGTVLGYWIADGPTSSWGELTVIAIDPVSGQPDHAQPILASTLARRGFTVGLNHVVWAAPMEGVRGGEVRVRFWGPDGFGDLRVVPPTGVVAAL